MTERKVDSSRRPLAELLAYIQGPARQQGESSLADAALCRQGESSLADAAPRQQVESFPANPAPRLDTAALLRQSYPELPVLDEFKTTWIKLSANRQLERAQEQVPDNAGPLHSSRLVTQALALMQTLSPDYLHTFMAYVDALSWTQQLFTENTSSENAARAASAKVAAQESGKASTKRAKPKARKS